MKSNIGLSQEGFSESVNVLLLAAKADREFDAQLRAVLRLPSFHRKAMIHTALDQMQAKGEPPLLIQAIALLANDANAAQMLSRLEA